MFFDFLRPNRRHRSQARVLTARGFTCRAQSEEDEAQQKAAGEDSKGSHWLRLSYLWWSSADLGCPGGYLSSSDGVSLAVCDWDAHLGFDSTTHFAGS